MPERPVTKAWRTLKLLGVGHMLLWLLDRLLFRLTGIQTILVRIHDRDWLREVPVPQIPPYEVRIAARDEVLAAIDGSPEWLEPRRVATQLARGEQCMAVFLDGRMVACSWCAADGPVGQGLVMHVGPRCVYGHEGKTRGEHRGKGLHAATVMLAGRLAARAGRSMVGYAYVGNVHAMYAGARMGPMTRGYVLFRERGGHAWTWVSPRCRRAGISVCQAPHYGGRVRTRPVSTCRSS